MGTRNHDSPIIVVLAVETRAFVTSDGAMNAEAPDAHATAITADFIFVSLEGVRKFVASQGAAFRGGMQARQGDDKNRACYRRPNPPKNYSARLGHVANFKQTVYLTLTTMANLGGLEGVDHSWGAGRGWRMDAVDS